MTCTMYNMATISFTTPHTHTHTLSPTVPRSNMFVYFSPIHINVHQESCLWLVEYANGVVQTVNLELAVSVKDEGKAFIVSTINYYSLPGHMLGMIRRCHSDVMVILHTTGRAQGKVDSSASSSRNGFQGQSSLHKGKL